MGTGLELALNGVVTGAAFALIAVGFAVVFGTCHLYDMGFAASLTAGAYAAYAVQRATGGEWLIALPVAIAGAAAVSALGYAILYRPLLERNAAHLVVIGTSIGYLVLVTHVIQFVFGSDVKPVLGASWMAGSVAIGDFLVRRVYLVGIAQLILILGLLYLLLRKTRVGRELRAVASNAELAASIGVDVPRTQLVAFALAGAISAPAALLLAVDRGANPTFGLNPFLIASLAVIVGGLGSPLGAAAGALALAVAQSVAVGWLPSEWQTAIAFGIAIAVLLVRPTGLTGQRLWKLEA